jgi:hypothetical protein
VPNLNILGGIFEEVERNDELHLFEGERDFFTFFGEAKNQINTKLSIVKYQEEY